MVDFFSHDASLSLLNNLYSNKIGTIKIQYIFFVKIYFLPFFYLICLIFWSTDYFFIQPTHMVYLGIDEQMHKYEYNNNFKVRGTLDKL